MGQEGSRIDLVKDHYMVKEKNKKKLCQMKSIHQVKKMERKGFNN